MRTFVFKNPLGGKRHSQAIGFAVLSLVLSSFCASCSEPYSFTSNQAVLSEGHEERTNIVFAMNNRPVRLELYIRVEGIGAAVEVDHPDGRTTEAIEVAGPGIRELCKEFPKEPGSWGLRITAKGGNAFYWVALHDRKRFIGPDEAARRSVEGE